MTKIWIELRKVRKHVDRLPKMMGMSLKVIELTEMNQQFAENGKNNYAMDGT